MRDGEFEAPYDPARDDFACKSPEQLINEGYAQPPAEPSPWAVELAAKM